VYPKVSGLSHNEINNNNNKHSLRRVMAAKLTRLTHKIATKLHLLADSRTIVSSLSRRTVRKLLDTFSYSFMIRFNVILPSKPISLLVVSSFSGFPIKISYAFLISILKVLHVLLTLIKVLLKFHQLTEFLLTSRVKRREIG
jgi:hypothetical protein